MFNINYDNAKTNKTRGECELSLLVKIFFITLCNICNVTKPTDIFGTE